MSDVCLEKYTRGVSAVESILTLDRLRQSVAVKELLQAQGQPLMRKTASVPNFSQVLLPLRRLGRTVCFSFNLFSSFSFLIFWYFLPSNSNISFIHFESVEFYKFLFAFNGFLPSF